LQALARLRSRSRIIDRFDLPRDPLEVRKVTISVKVAPSLRFKEQIEADGPTVFRHACKMASKRKGPRNACHGLRSALAGKPQLPQLNSIGLARTSPRIAKFSRAPAGLSDIHSRPWIQNDSGQPQGPAGASAAG
jgi:hypothetical protein